MLEEEKRKATHDVAVSLLLEEEYRWKLPSVDITVRLQGKRLSLTQFSGPDASVIVFDVIDDAACEDVDLLGTVLNLLAAAFRETPKSS